MWYSNAIVWLPSYFLQLRNSKLTNRYLSRVVICTGMLSFIRLWPFVIIKSNVLGINHISHILVNGYILSSITFSLTLTVTLIPVVFFLPGVKVSCELRVLICMHFISWIVQVKTIPMLKVWYTLSILLGRYIWQYLVNLRSTYLNGFIIWLSRRLLK